MATEQGILAKVFHHSCWQWRGRSGGGGVRASGPSRRELDVIHGLLPSGLQLGGDLAFRLGFRVVQQFHSGASHGRRELVLYRHFITKPSKTKRCRNSAAFRFGWTDQFCSGNPPAAAKLMNQWPAR